MQTKMFRDPVTRMYMQSKQKFDTLHEMGKKFSAGLAGLGELRALGRNVTHDDVLKHTVNLLQNGHVTAAQAAQVLSQVPKEGPALQEWVERQHQAVEQHTAQVGQAFEQARGDLANHSLNEMLARIADGGMNG